MLKKYGVLLMIAVLFLASCKGQDKPLELQNPFIGGTKGVIIDFQNLRTSVFDGGRDPFDIVIKLQNQGETSILKNKVHVKISGINPAEFSKLEEQLTKSSDDDIIASKKDAQGTVLQSPPVFVEFTELNHFSPIVGSKADFTIRADACYMYKTTGVSKLCVRSNILNPEAGGICEINENKVVYNSGSPLQFANVVESARAKDKIGFVFEVTHVGAGNIFEQDSACNTAEKNKADKVYLKIDSKLDGLTCTGLNNHGSVAEGFVTLFDGTKLVSCTQSVNTKSNFEQVVSIEASYDYEDFKQTTISVKNSGGTNSS